MDQSHGLFGFLQKRSLFQPSPINPANRKRSRSRSHSKDSRISDKLSNINAFDDRSMGSASKIQQRGQKFNYQYVNGPTNRAPEPKFMENQDTTSKAMANSFARNVKVQAQKDPADNNINVFQSTPFLENNPKHIPADNFKHQPFSLPSSYQFTPSHNAPATSSQIAANLAPITHNHGSSFGNKTNSNANYNASPQVSAQAIEQAAKNVDYSRFQATTSLKSGRGGFDMRSERMKQEDQLSNFNKSAVGLQNKIWADLVSYTTNFEAARVESIQCLQNLSLRIGSEISSINHKIQSLNAKMASVLDYQFEQLRRRITQIIENAFKEKQKYIYEYMNKKQSELAGQMMRVREILVKEGEGIESMKERLRTPQWRQAAGEILSTEVEKKVEMVLQRSREMHLGEWQVGDIESNHLRNIEKQLKLLLNLKNK